MIITSGILFVCACCSIYKSGDSPFSRESISAAFSGICIPVYITLSLTVINFGVHAAFPKDEEKLNGKRTPKILVEKLAAKVNDNSFSGDISDSINKERRLRRILGIVRIVLAVLSSVLPLIYLLNPDNFPAESGRYNAEISHGILLYIAFLLPLAIYEVVYHIVVERSYLAEHELLKAVLKEFGVSMPECEVVDTVIARIARFFNENKKPITLGVRIALVGSAIVFIVAGVINGGMADVLNKAIKICTECIGLG